MKKKSSKPTDAELAILQVLWQLGSCTVREVNDELSKEKEVGYTTTLKLMQIMTEKGLLIRDSSSRTHVYAAKVTEDETQKKLVDRLLNTAFGGSAMKLVMQALGNKKSKPEELQQIRNWLDEMEKEGK
ncbi:MAG: BlaI/MecI/CopY family transcriptional regulator [Flammeovirgaceae bacterium]